jgi:hypothetical protein
MMVWADAAVWIAMSILWPLVVFGVAIAVLLDRK